MMARRLQSVVFAAFGVLLLQVLLVLPSHPAGLTLSRWLTPVWEVALIVGLLVVAPWRAVRALVVMAVVALKALKLADLGTQLAFSRAFNPLLDLHMLVSGWALLSASVGLPVAALAVGGAVTVLALVAVLLWVSLGRLGEFGLRGRAIAVALPLAVAGVVAVTPGLRSMWATPLVVQQIDRIQTGVASLAVFTAALPEDPVPAPTFAALQGRDVIVAFVESYGRSFIDDPEFAALSAPRLSAVQDRLSDAGWSVHSGWLAAPTRGGQSWLSHGTLLSGLWVDSQIRYDRLMLSNRASLNRLFGAAGWTTGAAMPAITLHWPEAAWYGYDTTLDAAGLDYRGQPFEWVTMPDQYTWSALDMKLRQTGKPAMIEVALITSHAPWTPLPFIVPWEDVGDGAIFDGTQRFGDTPRAVWSDPVRIRQQYALSLDYALEVMGQYIARSGNDALFVVLGDHQPAALLAGQDAPPDVPVHIIATDPRLLDRLPADAFAPGMVPSADAPVLPMDAMRGLLTTIYEQPLTD
ncbi:Phosphoglycerol transferase MdoB [Loktanella fryxellensis]|uniref:Phosphoglycerol transferase MdoB n=1 Tax=Loktanella fryxellensis TaxID=245187 RepID=A0A1H8GQU8_9RHOB|nr:hypothetical protein [Loktanella fryxellensis]SEN46185.1 Phosphoglycerol transferase MdoB [Loktanella fryxellensis]